MNQLEKRYLKRDLKSYLLDFSEWFLTLFKHFCDFKIFFLNLFFIAFFLYRSETNLDEIIFYISVTFWHWSGVINWQIMLIAKHWSENVRLTNFCSNLKFFLCFFFSFFFRISYKNPQQLKFANLLGQWQQCPGLLCWSPQHQFLYHLKFITCQCSRLQHIKISRKA